MRARLAEEIASQVEDYRLPKDHRVTEDFDFSGTDTVMITMDTPIDESNVGYRLVAKMGWRKGTGLGSKGQGIAEPIRLDSAVGTLGLGKASEYDATADEAAKQRKLLAVEVEDTEDLKIAWQEKNAKDSKLKEEIAQITDAFYCRLCNKRYTNVSDYEQHLSSYDHHHKARFQDMKAAENARKREEASKKEQRREAKEMEKMMAAASRAAAAASTPAPATVGPSPPPDVSLQADGQPERAADAGPATAPLSTSAPSGEAQPLAEQRAPVSMSLGAGLGSKRKPMSFSLGTVKKQK